MTDSVLLTLRSLAPLFVIIGLGYGLKRWAVLHHEHVPILNLLVVNVLLPAAILQALLKGPSLSIETMKLPMILAAVELVALGGLALAASRIQALKPDIGALLLTAAFGNTAFLGYPIAQSMAPGHFSSAVMLDQLGTMVVLYPMAAVLGALLSHSENRRGSIVESLKRFVQSPLFLALAAGIVLKAASGHVPQWGPLQPLGQIADHCLTLLGQAATPVVLIALGLSLEPRGGGGRATQLLAAGSVKLLFLPAMALGMAWMAGVSGEARTVLVLQAAMPAGVLTGILAHEHGLGGKLGVASVFFSTCVSAVTIPLVLSALRLLP